MSKKRRLGMVMLGLSMMVLSFGCAKKEVKKATFHSEHGVTVTYPEDWEIKKEELHAGMPILLMKNDNANEEEFNSNINLNIISHKGEELDFNKFMQINKNYLTLHNIKLQEEAAVTIDGHPAYKLVYHMVDQGDALTLVQYLQLYDEVGYTTTFVCLDEKYDALKEEVIEIMEGFHYDFNKK